MAKSKFSCTLLYKNVQVKKLETRPLAFGILHTRIYNHELLKLDDSWFMKQNADFQEGIWEAHSAATPLHIPISA